MIDYGDDDYVVDVVDVVDDDDDDDDDWWSLMKMNEWNGMFNKYTICRDQMVYGTDSVGMLLFSRQSDRTDSSVQ